MLYGSHQFDLPARRYAFRNAVEPTLVEATDEANATSHLVDGDASGGAYMRTHVYAVERITDAEFVTGSPSEPVRDRLRA